MIASASGSQLASFAWGYVPFWTPAAFVVAVLTILVVPYLSLIVFMVALLATAAAVVAGVVAAPFLVVRVIRRHGRARIAATERIADTPAVGAATGDSVRRLSCSS